jgi:ribosomal protein S20
MTGLRGRLAKLEAARGARPDPDAAAAFAELAEALDRLAARKVAGDETAHREIEALAAALDAGRA